MTAADIPFDGQFFPAKEKKFGGTVFFVHFFEGNKQKLRRHIFLVNRLGCDAFAFNLQTPPWHEPPFAADGGFGIKHLYADQIELLLNRIAGPKLIYSFSNPTASAIEAMARRHCVDTIGLIADSGPSAAFVTSVNNLYTHEKKISWPLRLPLIPLFAATWSPLLHTDLKGQLNSFPDNFPILSIQGWKDPLIPPQDIDAVFSGHPQLDWRKLSLPQAGHLNGLRDFREEYEPAVADFLSKHMPALKP